MAAFETESSVAPLPSAEDASKARLYLNRELSWLAFNERVLAQASDDSPHPLLERVKFLAIAANNLDEFYMVRLATLRRAAQSPLSGTSIDGMNRSDELAMVRQRATRLLGSIEVHWDRLRPELAAEGITLVDRDAYSPEIRSYLSARFLTDIYPVLTPLAFDPGHPFPHMSNRSKNVAVVVHHNDRLRFARVKVPDVLPRFIPLPAALVGGPDERNDAEGRCPTAYALLEDVILDNIQALFPGAEVRSAHLFHILRDTDVVLASQETEDLLESLDQSLRRLRHSDLILLTVDRDMPPRVLSILLDNFEAEADIVHAAAGRLAFADWAQLAATARPDLKDPPLQANALWENAEPPAIFDHIRQQDVLVHHPFDSYDTVDRFLNGAARDPDVLAIKIALYRLEVHPPVIDLLIAAADLGKQVAVVLELKARFDERSNITLATRLEDAGIHVVYGLPGLKTHCKVCLVIRQEQDSTALRRYAHIATGNYNQAEARVFTDLGLFTARTAIVDEISELFNHLTGYGSNDRYRHVIVAPLNMRVRLKALLEREAAHARAGRPARVIFKTNAISDPEFIADLYATAGAGVDVDLIVRGICCARPGVPGLSERIHVRSLVGRFLEHSRCYWFANGGEDEAYLGSPDLMERNFNRRVELLCPVLDPGLKAYLRDDVLETCLRDNTAAHVLAADGTYRAVSPSASEPRVSAQEVLMRTPTLGRTAPPTLSD